MKGLLHTGVIIGEIRGSLVMSEEDGIYIKTQKFQIGKPTWNKVVIQKWKKE